MQAAQARHIALVGLFAALTAVGAVFSIPVGTVPFSLQLLFTLLSGALLGSRLGSLSQASYVLMGLIGLPVFAMRRAGFGVLAGPTGGFLVGFILAAWVTGWIIERFTPQKEGNEAAASPGIVFLAMLAGALVTYVPGIAWLAWHVGGIRPATVSMLPFVPGDLVKAVIGTGIVTMLQVRGLWIRLGQGAGR